MRHSLAITLLVFTFVTLAPALPGAKEHLEKFRDCPTCPELVEIPAGDFIMGRTGKYNNEGPAHRVTIARPFAMGVYEVTFDEWRACFDGGGCAVMPDDHKWGRDAGR